MLIPNYFEDLDTLHLNTLPRRNYYIPYASFDEAHSTTDRRKSSNYFDLNGEWNFHYFNNVRLIDEEYWLSKNADNLNFDKIQVPSSWQLEGYGQIQYTNTEYPIPFDPPYVPYDNPAGLYKRSFNLSNYSTDKSYHLNFEGVDSAFYVWVNNQFVGYSQVSHSNTEFDLTSYLKEENNDLSVLVLQWSDGTYLEDQDKFRYSGIFRDVYLLERSTDRINHFKITTDVDESLDEATIDLSILSRENVDTAKLKLYDPDGKILINEEIDLTNPLSLTINNPMLWDAEHPHLYLLIIGTEAEYFRQEIGLRKVEIKDKQLFINHKSIKLIGVNHHDTNPNTGATVTIEDQIKDLELMKQYNFNAIRTAHYPKTAEFYELTDRYGYYVMSESDLETHGVVDLYGLGENDNYNMIAEDDHFTKSFVDRMDASMIPFMNYSSIIMWSAGNESGYGIAVEKSMEHARHLDPTRPLHYEAYWYHDREKEYDTQYLDMWSRMYPSVEEIKDTYFKTPIDRPFIICEYIHAMGNGPGDIKEYYDFMMETPEFIGGFVWEWADHAVNLNRDTDKNPVYRYGGDHGEYPHAGNFCMDGLMYPDRTPHTGVLEHRQIFRPLVLVDYSLNDLTFKFKNSYDFSNANEKLTVLLELYNSDGEKTEEISVDRLDILPQDTGQLSFDNQQIDLNSLNSLRFVYYAKDSNIELGFDQVIINEYQPSFTILPATTDLKIKETLSDYIVYTETNEVSFSKRNGAISHLIANGESLLNEPGTWDIWRAPIDNDRNIQKKWEEANFHHTSVRIHTHEFNPSQDGYDIVFKGVLNSVARQNILTLNIKWTVTNDGNINLNIDVEKDPIFPFLPRFGLCLPLKNSFDTITYYGQGPFESYIDKKYASHLALFNNNVDDLYEPYVTPQENGAHNLTHFISVSNKDSQLEVISKEGLSFNYSNYSTKQLTETMHRDQLEKEDTTYLHIDYQHSGTGSNACGPELYERYQLNDEKFSFNFTMKFK